jgi:hypothetical protein
MTHAIAGLSGLFMKSYDDIVDNPEAYAELYDKKIILEILVVACVVYFAHLDSIAMIACLFTLLTDILIYLYNRYHPVLNINYAIDTPVWAIGMVLIVILFIYKSPTLFTSLQYTDYVIIIAGFLVIFMDAISLTSTKKEIIEDPFANMLYLEASDNKLVMRILPLCGSIMAAVLIQFSDLFYQYARPLQYIFTWGITYFLTSTVSILYLKSQYKKEDIIAAAKKRLFSEKNATDMKLPSNNDKKTE